MTLVMRPGYGGAAVSDPDAMAYLQAVEVADNEALEQGVQQAVNQFVIGCKADGIWNAIKASCILAGARTLTGALVPLVGTAPTNFNFVSGDYNRETGLVGDGSTKYLNSNRNNNADPQNNQHLSVYVSTAATDSANTGYIGAGLGVSGASQIARFASAGSTNISSRSRSSTVGDFASGTLSTTGLIAISRSTAGSYTGRLAGSNTNFAVTSDAALDQNIVVFGRNLTAQATARLAFYSIGESLNLALLDARVTDLINAFAAAIP